MDRPSQASDQHHVLTDSDSDNGDDHNSDAERRSELSPRNDELDSTAQAGIRRRMLRISQDPSLTKTQKAREMQVSLFAEKGKSEEKEKEKERRARASRNSSCFGKKFSFIMMIWSR